MNLLAFRAKNYLAMGNNILVIRHQQSGGPQMIADTMDAIGSGVKVLNAGDRLHAHPSQALARSVHPLFSPRF